tara:strand:- start:27 stop:476 length:450 start_codon:yes stop_codon:yes gene_type:complete
MAPYRYQNGPGHVGSYQISGIPYATASVLVPALGAAPLEINFPNVTKYITISNEVTNAKIRVGFSALGVTGSNDNAGGVMGSGNYYVLVAGEDKLELGDIRVESIYLLADATSAVPGVSLVAGLTGVHTGSIPGRIPGTLNWSGSSGVG